MHLLRETSMNVPNIQLEGQVRLSQKNKFVIYSTTYAGWGGTHPLQVGAGFHARPLLGQPHQNQMQRPSLTVFSFTEIGSLVHPLLRQP